MFLGYFSRSVFRSHFYFFYLIFKDYVFFRLVEYCFMLFFYITGEYSEPLKYSHKLLLTENCEGNV